VDQRNFKAGLLLINNNNNNNNNNIHPIYYIGSGGVSR
jgi:hypothetical protein